MALCDILRSLRVERGWSQQELGQKLEAMGCGTSQKAVSRWERGSSEPNIRQFVALCELYDVRDVPAVFGGRSSRETLNALGKKRVLEYIRLLEQDAEFSLQPRERKHGVLRTLPLYDLPVSAGTGQFLDSSDYTLMEVDETVPLAATFAVRIRGDSMLPRFADRQIVFVRQQQTLEPGEVGIFVLDGDAYCKLLSREEGTQLVSLNPAYPPIPVREFSELRILGKVLA